MAHTSSAPRGTCQEVPLAKKKKKKTYIHVYKYIQICIMLWIKCTTCLLDEYTLNWADCYFISNDVGLVSGDFSIIMKTLWLVYILVNVSGSNHSETADLWIISCYNSFLIMYEIIHCKLLKFSNHSLVI